MTARLFPLAVALILVIAASSIPGDFDAESATSTGQRLLLSVPPYLQNLMHLPVYAVLGAAWLFALGNTFGRTFTPVVALAATIAIAVADEYYQTLIPGRFTSFHDLQLDALGGLLGIAIYMSARSVLRGPR